MLKHIGIYSFSSLLYFLNIFRRRVGVVVLNYHRVSDLLPADHLNTPPDLFRMQMRYLKYNCQVLSVRELLRPESRVLVQQKRVRPYVIITFDDGYRDNYLNAFPVLKEFSLPACFFMITNLIGTNEKRPRYQHMPSPDMMNWDEAREMSCYGIDFCSHSCSHPHLNLLDEAAQRDEIEKSIQEVKKNMESDLCEKIFCYPYGDRNEQTLKILKEIGVQYAFTTEPGINNRKTPPLELKRNFVNGKDDEFDLRKKIAGSFDWISVQKEKNRKKEVEELRLKQQDK